MYDTQDGWDMDREQADFDQAELEAAGRHASKMRRKSLAARLQGDLALAARLCRHGWTQGDNCHECGSVMGPCDDLTPMHERPVVTPCAGPFMCLKCNLSLAIADGRGECASGHKWFLKSAAPVA